MGGSLCTGRRARSVRRFFFFDARAFFFLTVRDCFFFSSSIAEKERVLQGFAALRVFYFSSFCFCFNISCAPRPLSSDSLCCLCFIIFFSLRRFPVSLFDIVFFSWCILACCISEYGSLVFWDWGGEGLGGGGGKWGRGGLR